MGFDSWDKYQMGDQNVYPGPVDNSGLLKGQPEFFSLYRIDVKYLSVKISCVLRSFVLIS